MYGQEIDGITTEPPLAILDTSYDKVVIAIADNMKVCEVKQNLKVLGVQDDTVIWKNYLV